MASEMSLAIPAEIRMNMQDQYDIVKAKMRQVII